MFSGKNKKKTFLAAMTMLLVSAIVITSASFAWFSLGKNAMVNNIDVKVTAKSGLLISANITDFTDVITYANLSGKDTDDATKKYNAVEGNVNYFTEQFSPASSDFKLDSTTKLPVFFNGSISKSETETVTLEGGGSTPATVMEAAKVEEASKTSLYAFDVYIQYFNDDPAATVVINVGKSSIKVKDQADQDDGVTANAKVEDAFRIGFVNCGVVDEKTAATDIKVAPKGTAQCMYANNATAKNTLPVISAGKSADLGSAATVSTTNKGTLNLASAYACNVAIKGETASTAQLTLSTGINRIRVYIWMEGQDANCIDDMASQKLSINLVFDQAA